MNDIEIWKDIPEFEGLYQISNYGKVKSLDRYIEDSFNGKRFRKGKYLSPGNNGTGYLFINLWKNNKQHRFYIHRLVCLLFKEDYDIKLDINHKDGIKKNNHHSNLECVTPSENMYHSYNNNLHKSGENHVNSKLLNSDIETIIEMLSNNIPQNIIANKFNVSQQLISNINTNKRKNVVTIRDYE